MHCSVIEVEWLTRRTFAIPPSQSLSFMKNTSYKEKMSPFCISFHLLTFLSLGKLNGILTVVYILHHFNLFIMTVQHYLLLLVVQSTTQSHVKIPVYQHSAGGWDSDFELATPWPSLVSMATDLRETARSLVWEEAGESGATHYHDVQVRQSSRQSD